jgi:hypothetical protein
MNNVLIPRYMSSISTERKNSNSEGVGEDRDVAVPGAPKTRAVTINQLQLEFLLLHFNLLSHMTDAFGVVTIMEIISLKVLIEYVYRISIPFICESIVIGIYYGQLKLCQRLRTFFGASVKIVFRLGSD